MLSLSTEKKEKIRQLHELTPGYNMVILVFLGVWALAAYLVLQLSGFWPRLPFYFLIGGTLHALAIVVHEASHSNLYRSQKRLGRWANRWLGFLSGVPTLLSVSAYQAVHLPHHRYVRGLDDPDEFENITRRPLWLRIILLIWFGVGAYAYVFHTAFTGLKLANRQTRSRIIQEYLLIALLVGLAVYLAPPDVLLHVWLIPALITAQFVQVRSLVEHIFTGGDNALTASRTVTSNFLVSFFLINANYHLEHHLYPGVPWYRLRELHSLLLDDFRRAGASIYSSYLLYLWDACKAIFAAVPAPASPARRGYYLHYMPVLPRPASAAARQLSPKSYTSYIPPLP